MREMVEATEDSPAAKTKEDKVTSEIKGSVKKSTTSSKTKNPQFQKQH